MKCTPSFVVLGVVAIFSAACSSQSMPAAPSATGAVKAAEGLTSNAVVSAHAVGTPELLTPATCPLMITGAGATPNTLWSPNHKWNDVAVSYDATDVCSLVSAPTCSLSVTSNEPVNGLGDGNTSPDWVVVNNHLVRLRAERSGTGDGRVYTIAITCTATVNDTTTTPVTTFPVSAVQTTNVTVAHDQGK